MRMLQARSFGKLLLYIVILVAGILLTHTECIPVTTEQSELFDAGIALLQQRGFAEKATAIDKIAASGDERAERILSEMLAGRLYLRKSDDTLVYVTSKADTYTIVSALSAEPFGVVKKRKLKKISINNRLRGKLKSTLAQMRLTHPDPSVRLEAIHKMLGTFTPDDASFLNRLLAKEPDSDVKTGLKTAMALLILKDASITDTAIRLSAIEKLAHNMNPSVRNLLEHVYQNETDADIRQKAKSILDGISTRLALINFFETLFFGLSLGSVLVLAAIGLAITFGVVGVINMAHGELIMLGAYATYVIQQLLPNSVGVALLLAIPTAFAVSAIVGIIIERTIIRFLYGRPLETLLATFGISLILQQGVRTIFSPLNRSVVTPDWMSGSVHVGAMLSLTTNRVVILVFTLLVFVCISLLLKKSAIGLHVRAVSQNRAMARAMGVKASRVDALTFGLGAGIAGIAGVALAQLTNVGPNLGQAYIVDSFMVVVFGGVGNLWGTLLGGLSLGVANKFLEPLTGAVLAKIAILVGIILFIQKRPQGLFPQKGRAVE